LIIVKLSITDHGKIHADRMARNIPFPLFSSASLGNACHPRRCRQQEFSGECEAENADDRDGRLSRVTIVLHFF